MPSELTDSNGVQEKSCKMAEILSLLSPVGLPYCNDPNFIYVIAQQAFAHMGFIACCSSGI